MRFRCLGCDGGIGGEFRTTSFLVDDDVVIDCGTGVGDLAAAELARVTDVFLTHAHVDHTGFLPMLIDATIAARAEPLVVHGTTETLDALARHVFNNEIWPDFTRIPTPERPFLRYATLAVGEAMEVKGRHFTALPVAHTVPAVGYHLDSGRASLVFSGDTGPCDSLWRAVNKIGNLKHLIVETSYGDEQQWIAEASGHLCPKLLAEELEKLERPAEILLTHMKPSTHETIMREVGARSWRSQPRQLARGQIIEF